MNSLGHVCGMTREDANAVLRDNNIGNFILRSGTQGLALSVKNKEQEIEHYKVNKEGSQYSLDEENFFDTLKELIKHYQDYPLNGSTKLTSMNEYYD